MGGHGGAVVVVGGREASIAAGAGPQGASSAVERGEERAGKVRDWGAVVRWRGMARERRRRTIGYRRSRLMDGRTAERGEADYYCLLNK